MMSELCVSCQAACGSVAGTLLAHPYSGAFESSITNSFICIKHSPTGLPHGSTICSL